MGRILTSGSPISHPQNKCNFIHQIFNGVCNIPAMVWLVMGSAFPPQFAALKETIPMRLTTVVRCPLANGIPILSPDDLSLLSEQGSSQRVAPSVSCICSWPLPSLLLDEAHLLTRVVEPSTMTLETGLY